MSGNCDNCGEHALECGCDMCEAWIDVNERLPDVDGHYLAFWFDIATNTKFISEVLYQKECGFTFVRNPDKVTHWMKLPEIPKNLELHRLLP